MVKTALVHADSDDVQFGNEFEADLEKNRTRMTAIVGRIDIRQSTVQLCTLAISFHKTSQ